MPTSSSRLSWTFLTFVVCFTVPTFGQVVTATLPTGVQPFGAAVNQVTNKIYISNLTCSQTPPCPSAGTVTVIDGATNDTATVNVGVYPIAVAVNSATNKIYVANYCGGDVNCASAGTVTVIDGVTNSTTSVMSDTFRLRWRWTLPLTRFTSPMRAAMILLAPARVR